MQRKPFFIVDVFAEKKYAGNQLAVVKKAGALPENEMQRIAREINFPETTFILSGEQRDGEFDSQRVRTLLSSHLGRSGDS